MEVRNCRECGRLFNYIGGPRMCPNCKKKLEDQFVQVRTYVKEHKDASVQEVSEANDVSVQQIRQWVREERLSFSSDSPIGIDCEKCGKMIRSGRFCPECVNEMTNGFNSAMGRTATAYVPPKKTDTRDGARMRFLDNK